VLCLTANLPLKAQEWQPQASPREKKNFNSNWLFFRGEIENDAAGNPSFDDKNWQTVHLPHSPRITPLRLPWRSRDNQGISWYRKHFQLSEKYHGRRIFVEFEGADQVAEVWINGTKLMTHVGAYLPFVVDIAAHAKFGDRSNLIAVKVDNHTNRDIPAYGNWISYGGLYRDVYLHSTDALHITEAIHANKTAGGGVFVTYPLVNESLVHINIKTHVLNEYQQAKTCKIKTHLVDAGHRLVATVETEQRIDAGRDVTFDQLMRLSEFHLWHPDHPYLYTLHSEIYDDQKLSDSYDTKIGIRRIQFSRDGGFSINGERLMFMGTNRVQDYAYVAWAFPNSAQRRDALRLKEGGFQYVRSSHNAQDPAFLAACDEFGILVMDCIPGFQFVGGPKFQEHSYQNMRDTMRRDRNHPAVILWELSLNETEFDSNFALQALRIGHEEYPGDQCFVAGWKFPSVYDVYIRATQHGARDYSGSAPLVISEYGHWDYGGGNSTSDVERKDGEGAMLVQAKNHQESLSLNRGLPFLCGDGLWVGIDFQSFPSGVMDYFRLPKFSYYFYQSQRDPRLIHKGIDSGPMVYIANYWTENSPRTFTVYSNCERVDLFLNEQLVASQKPDTGACTENLLHPPFTFTDIPWKSGELKAIGYINEKESASHKRVTPGQATALALDSDLEGPASADGEDMFFVYASVIDKNGTVVRDVMKVVTFQVTGPAILVSPASVETEAGTATALIRTTTQPGQMVVKAEAEGLKVAMLYKSCVEK
jgi:beta-galactosidase